MTFAPASITALGAYWTAHGGVNLGIVGNAAHTRGYHLGKDRIYDGAGPGVGDADYSVQQPRDKAGLTNAAAAIDLGRLNGSLAELRDFNRWFVDRCMALHATTYRDVREYICTLDGKTVVGWSALQPDRLIPGYGDLSHLGHAHAAFWRDAQARDKVGLIRGYFEEELDMVGTVTRTPYAGGPATWRVAAGVTLNGYDPAKPGQIVKTMTFSSPSTATASAEAFVAWTPAPGPVPRGGPFLQVVDGYFAGLLIVKALVTVSVPDDETPYSQADLDEAIAGNEAKWERWVATHP